MRKIVYLYGLKIRTSVKRPASNVRNAIGNIDLDKAKTIFKCIMTNRIEAAAHGHTLQSGAIRKQAIFHYEHTVGQGYAFQAGATFECRLIDHGNLIRNCYVGKTCASGKGRCADTFNTVGNRDAFQTCTIGESGRAYAYNAV